MNKVIKGFFLSLTFSSLLLALTPLEVLIKQQNETSLKSFFQKVKIIYSEQNMPSNAKEGDVIILEDDYNLKTLYEFKKNRWRSIDTEIVVKLLNQNANNSYKHLFNYKLDNSTFVPYATDNIDSNHSNK